MKLKDQLEVFYDGLCVICSREISHYRKCRGGNRIEWIDVSLPEFEASKHGLVRAKVQKYLHSKRGDRVFLGVDTFVEIWRELDGFRWLVRPVGFWPVRATLELGYAIFVRVRPYLPRKACPDSVCFVEERGEK